MRISGVQTYSPKNLEETLQILYRHPLQFYILSGGTDLVVKMQDGVIHPKHLLNLSFVRELKGFSSEDGQIVLGTNVTFGEILENSLFRKQAEPLYQAAKCMGSPQIRNLATLGGNIINASPAADSVPPLFVLNAEVCLESVNSIRWVKIEHLAAGPGKTIRKPFELLTKIRFPIKPASWHGGFLRLGQREALAISKVSLAYWGVLENGVIQDIRLALGAVAPTVIQPPKTEAFLKGNTLTETEMTRVAEILKTEVHPISDIRSNETYRREMCGVLLKRALRQLMTQCT
ncbi:nicotinate dehydrogenase FAD-subunit [bacterium BMS3Abin05]|nr:nicotinate dehydrogenase FAD-subunit [bacterium BMS3Abin05]GBE28387.1 nicotinate dehydrogenase FAD-subunit [bacterium BMS3Bbin03]HDK36259.1 xanthine dehydrogenase family protein subunit M [Bacteroidota bacterium]HDZ12946.1 xanthine dehydrogenase family protein subunit M [Bacteroidota bacterium]